MESSRENQKIQSGAV